MKAKDVRRGSILMYKNAPHKVLSFEHRSPGKGHALVQVVMRNLENGIQCNTRFNSTEDIPEADVFVYKASFMYADGNHFYFMNSSNFEETAISEEMLGDGRYYLHDGMEVEIISHEGTPIGITLPKTVVLTVVDTEPELKGATATNSPKPAKTDTGLQLSVPPFIKIGERILVDTEEGAYLSRADE